MENPPRTNDELRSERENARADLLELLSVSLPVYKTRKEWKSEVRRLCVRLNELLGMEIE